MVSLFQLLRSGFGRDVRNQPIEPPRDVRALVGDSMAVTTRGLEALLKQAGYTRAESRHIAGDIARQYRKGITNGTIRN
jgi:hypothetical protein